MAQPPPGEDFRAAVGQRDAVADGQQVIERELPARHLIVAALYLGDLISLVGVCADEENAAQVERSAALDKQLVENEGAVQIQRSVEVDVSHQRADLRDIHVGPFGNGECVARPDDQLLGAVAALQVGGGILRKHREGGRGAGVAREA